jgi:hypothetical protein
VRETDLDPSLAFTALFDIGALKGLTVEEGQTLRWELLTGWYAQEEIRDLYAYTRRWWLLHRAAQLGTKAGVDAAGWVFDGNTTEHTYRTVLTGIKEGDPLVLDSIEGEPHLGAVYGAADLAADLNIPKLETAVVDTWEAAARDGFWHEIERTARHHLRAE